MYKVTFGETGVQLDVEGESPKMVTIGLGMGSLKTVISLEMLLAVYETVARVMPVAYVYEGDEADPADRGHDRYSHAEKAAMLDEIRRGFDQARVTR